jgi:tRNA(Ile2) C34 agmatinyltransferase TiaS|tara:strand:- start:134 stop:343 length:210 start_codon:yes stop_codon:yes gene_type:complete
MRVHAEIVNGVCPTCTEFTMLVGVTKTFYRCMNCGADLEQHVNGRISYIPHLHQFTLQSEVDKYFNNEE